MGNKNYEFNKSDYDKMPVSWPDLEEMSSRGCACQSPECDKKFTETNPMEMAVHCHKGYPLWVSYWDGWLYLRCSKCDKPVCRVPVGRSLLP